MIVSLLAVDPALGAAGTLRLHSARLRAGTCLLVATRDPVAVDLAALLGAHEANAAALTIAVRPRRDGERADALIVGDDDRLIAVQPAPHPDEGLSDLADGGVYAVSPEVLDHLGESDPGLAAGVVPTLLEWGARVYAHR